MVACVCDQEKILIQRVNNSYPRPFKVKTNGSTLKTVEPDYFLKKRNRMIKSENNEFAG